MASTEKLIIELDAKVGTLKSELDAVNKKLDQTEQNAGGADDAMVSFAGAAKTGALAVAGAVTAFTAFVTITAKSRQELQLLASQTGLAAGEFEALAFATETYGVTAEQIADISKDLSDKIGEFATVGTGAFQDVADVLGLTKEEAIAFSESLSGLTSQEQIQEISNQLEAVNASAEQTTFVFESLGNDLSRLAPLFAENGRELDSLTSRYNAANSELSLTNEQERDLAELAKTFSLLTDQMGNAASKVSAVVAPIFDSFFNAVIDVVPEATNTIVDFFNKFQEAASINDIESINREITELTQTASDYEEQLNSMLSGEYSQIFGNDEAIQNQADGLSEVNTRLAELKLRRDELLEQQTAIDEVNARTGGAFSGGIGGVGDGEDNSADIEAIAARFKTEEELLKEKLERELEIIGENKELELALIAEYENAKLDLQIARVDAEIASQDKLAANAKKNRENDLKEEKSALSSKATELGVYASAATAVGDLLFEDNKALRAGAVVVDTAAGIMRTYAEYGATPTGIAAAAAVAAAGVAQLSAISSASKGSSSTSSSGTVSSVAEVTDDVTTDQSELSIAASDTSGSNQQITIKIDSDDSDTASFISSLLENAKITGTL